MRALALPARSPKRQYFEEHCEESEDANAMSKAVCNNEWSEDVKSYNARNMIHWTPWPDTKWEIVRNREVADVF